MNDHRHDPSQVNAVVPAAAGTGWEHLSAEDLQFLNESAADPATWDIRYDDLAEPIIGWSVTFPKDGTLAELLFRSEAAARQAATTIPAAVVSAFSTPDASWHRWEDQA